MKNKNSTLLLHTYMRQHQILRSLPNFITALRIACAPIIIFGTYFPTWSWLSVTAIVFGVISDKIDGTLARLLHAESDTGKQLESIGDPLFTLGAMTYVMTQTDFPIMFLWLGIAIFTLCSISRLVLYMKYGKFFFQKSEVTRVFTALLFGTIIMYVFALPLRLLIACVTLLWGGYTGINYLYMQYEYAKKLQK